MPNGRSEPYRRVVDIMGSETNLNGGRFWNYNAEVRSHSVSVDMRGFLSPAAAIVIEWIAENCIDSWSFHLGKRFTGKRYDGLAFTIFFQSKEDAVLFRLALIGNIYGSPD